MDRCWNIYLNESAVNVCAEGATQLIGERNNVERYVGMACVCDANSLESDGFKCGKCAIDHRRF
ncbi:unnamed protein product [Anisakis simplex]|uniref:DUF2769 domain-containing protein n=1 Tax=Anisakis simplex TaxID=6269 RepID=A0A0M3JN48_ANISI|nr:unnamed protein product [Anisakis simplex]